jgi:hypothetical protein
MEAWEAGCRRITIHAIGTQARQGRTPSVGRVFHLLCATSFCSFTFFLEMGTRRHCLHFHISVKFQRPNKPPQSTLAVDCFSVPWSLSDTYHQYVDPCLESCNSSSTTVPKIIELYSTHEICTCGPNISGGCSQQCFLAGVQQRCVGSPPCSQ